MHEYAKTLKSEKPGTNSLKTNQCSLWQQRNINNNITIITWGDGERN